MRPTAWTLMLALGVLAAREGAAQGAGSNSTRSTLSGVYTAGQATRGQDIYALACQACHTPASHTGPAFVLAWKGRPLSELFGYIMETMPKSDPGALTAEEYVLITAYLLRMNGLPAGSEELSPDPAELKRIRFETRRNDPQPRK